MQYGIYLPRIHSFAALYTHEQYLEKRKKYIYLMYKYTNLGKRGIKYINKWCYVFTVWVIACKIKYWTVVSY